MSTDEEQGYTNPFYMEMFFAAPNFSFYSITKIESTPHEDEVVVACLLEVLPI
jgi:hypothetical protein